MAAYVLHYVLLLLLLLGLDAVWLMTMVNRLYKPELGDLLADGFKPLPAGLFYLIYAAGAAGRCRSRWPIWCGARC